MKAREGHILGHGGLGIFFELRQHRGTGHGLSAVVGRELQLGRLAHSLALFEGDEELLEVLFVEVKAVFALEAVDVGLL